MKRIVTTALALSLLAGTSALAQTRSGDPRESRAEARERLTERPAERRAARAEKAEAKEERREQKVEARPERREEKAEARRPVPRVQVDRDEPRRQPGNRLEVLRERDDARREAERRAEAQPRAERREQRIDLREQRERRQVVEERQRQQAQAQHVPDWLRHYRPGDGRVRDRDRDRHHYDHRHWKPYYHAPRRYRVPVYIYPSRWYVRAWAFGDRLPYQSWYSPRYYLDWWRYGLPRPPIGTEWVRMRDDALLVDVWSGRVLAVYYNLFW